MYPVWKPADKQQTQARGFHTSSAGYIRFTFEAEKLQRMGIGTIP